MTQRSDDSNHTPFHAERKDLDARLDDLRDALADADVLDELAAHVEADGARAMLEAALAASLPNDEDTTVELDDGRSFALDTYEGARDFYAAGLRVHASKVRDAVAAMSKPSGGTDGALTYAAHVARFGEVYRAAKLATDHLRALFRDVRNVAPRRVPRAARTPRRSAPPSARPSRSDADDPPPSGRRRALSAVVVEGLRAGRAAPLTGCEERCGEPLDARASVGSCRPRWTRQGAT